MNRLTTEKRASILSALVEGNSVNATARLCDCSKVTVLRLLADAGVIKEYGNPPREAQARYSPGVCIGCEKRRVFGFAFGEDISTSHVGQRQNLTLRMGSRRYTRLTNGFSKKIENHWHALCLHYWHYNWSRKHQTLKTTPAVAAGIANRRMKMVELVETSLGGRVTEYLPSPKQ